LSTRRGGCLTTKKSGALSRKTNRDPETVGTRLKPLRSTDLKWFESSFKDEPIAGTERARRSTRITITRCTCALGTGSRDIGVTKIHPVSAGERGTRRHSIHTACTKTDLSRLPASLFQARQTRNWGPGFRLNICHCDWPLGTAIRRSNKRREPSLTAEENRKAS